MGTAIVLLEGEGSSIGSIERRDRLVYVLRIATGIARGIVVSIDVDAGWLWCSEIEAGELCSKQSATVAILQGLSQSYQSIVLTSCVTRGRRPRTKGNELAIPAASDCPIHRSQSQIRQ